jgi:hypothetical protein
MKKVAEQFKVMDYPCYCLEVDLKDVTAIEQAVEELYNHHPRWDILINNAATVIRAPLLDFKVEDWDLIANLTKRSAEIDILINNAGAIPAGDLETVDENKWRKAWDLKVFGYINMTRAFYHTMKNRDKNGVIINITGLSGIKLDANYIAGSSGNACLETFTRTAGAYSMDHGVRILSVSPTAVQTERIETLLKHKAESELGDAQLWEKYLTNLPL